MEVALNRATYDSTELVKEILKNNKLCSNALEEPLYAAARSGNVYVIKSILEKCEDFKKERVNSKIGFSALVQAIKNNNVHDVATTLLNEGISYWDTDDRGRNVIYYAIDFQNSKVLGSIFKADAGLGYLANIVDSIIPYVNHAFSQSNDDTFESFKQSVEKEIEQWKESIKDIKNVISLDDSVAYSNCETTIVSSGGSPSKSSKLDASNKKGSPIVQAIDDDYAENKGKDKLQEQEYLYTNTKNLLNSNSGRNLFNLLKDGLAYCYTWHNKKGLSNQDKQYNALPYIQFLLKEARNDDQRCEIIASALFDAYWIHGTKENLEDVLEGYDVYRSDQFIETAFTDLQKYSEKDKNNKSVAYLGNTMKDITRYITEYETKRSAIQRFSKNLKYFNFSACNVFKYLINDDISRNHCKIIDVNLFNLYCTKEEASSVLKTSVRDAINHNKLNSLSKLIQVAEKLMISDSIYKVIFKSIGGLGDNQPQILKHVINKHSEDKKDKVKLLDLLADACSAAVGCKHIKSFQHLLAELTKKQLKESLSSRATFFKPYMYTAIGSDDAALVLALLSMPPDFGNNLLELARALLKQKLHDKEEEKEDEITVNALLVAATNDFKKSDDYAENVHTLLSNALKQAGKEKKFKLMTSFFECANKFKQSTKCNDQLLQYALVSAMKGSSEEKHYDTEIADMMYDINKLDNFTFIDVKKNFNRLSKIWGRVKSQLDSEIVKIYVLFMRQYLSTPGSATPSRTPSRERSSIVTRSRSRNRVTAGAVTSLASTQSTKPRKLDFNESPINTVGGMPASTPSNDGNSILDQTYTIAVDEVSSPASPTHTSASRLQSTADFISHTPSSFVPSSTQSGTPSRIPAPTPIAPPHARVSRCDTTTMVDKVGNRKK